MSTTVKEQVAIRRRQALVDAASAAARMDERTATEHERYRDASRSSSAQLQLEQSLDRLAKYAELEQRLSRFADESAVYLRGGRSSFLADVYSASNGNVAAQDRLAAHRRAEQAQRRFVESRDLGAGTTPAIVPTWIFSEIPTSTISSPFLNGWARRLPKAFVVNEPGFDTPPVAGAQNGLNGATTPSGAVVTNATSVEVKTYNTEQDLSVQLLEQSPREGLDECLLPALVGAVNGEVEADIFGGDGTAGTLTGFTAMSSTSTATWNSGTATLVEFVSEVEGLVRTTQAAAGGGARRPTLVLHPRRASWVRERQVVEGVQVVSEPTSGRFDFTLNTNVDVLVSPGVPTAFGSGDVAVVISDPSAVSLRAGAVGLSMYPGIAASDELTTRLQVVRYVTLASRLPASIGILSGSGLVDPDS
jgi:hypothetical protein